MQLHHGNDFTATGTIGLVEGDIFTPLPMLSIDGFTTDDTIAEPDAPAFPDLRAGYTVTIDITTAMHPGTYRLLTRWGSHWPKRRRKLWERGYKIVQQRWRQQQRDRQREAIGIRR